MQDRVYLLSIREFLEAGVGEAYIQRAFSYMDEERRRKAEHTKQPVAKASCLGAGLLLQIALQEALGERGLSANEAKEAGVDVTAKTVAPIEAVAGDFLLERYTVSELFASLEHPLSLEFQYGKHGKPYLKNYSYFFNLSHSGEYVICVLSEQEVGVDIQQHREDNVLRLARRFFSRRECEELEECPENKRRAFFFGLWAKKEAYGKLTGEGVTEVLGLDFEDVGSEIQFKEYTDIPDYSIAICKKRRRKV